MFVFALLSALLIFLDLLTKRVAVTYLVGGADFTFIPALLRFIYVENTGAAFGILQDMRWFLVLVAWVVVLVILWYIISERCRSRLQYYGFIFVFAGSVGNLINRFLLGYVIDFINIPAAPRFPTFNLADIFINIGVLLLVIYIFKQSGKEV
ncbi:MAG: signal peptidase II [Candidatus Margulisbacteria bacterium]|jgi:signal peptidase II|nr:signal peptidase II [Candidatus Margulisiibacteriota bacterium]